MSSIFFRTLALMSVLLCGVSADAAISLHCNQPENVTSGDDRNLTCVIKLIQDDCKKVSVVWNDAVEDLCVNNTCTSDNKTFATLQMLKVTENKNITVKVDASCGKDKKTVSVKVYHGVHSHGTTVTPGAIMQITTSEPPEKDKTIAIALAAVSAVVIVVVVVGVWYRSKRVSPAGEALTGPIKTEKTSEKINAEKCLVCIKMNEEEFEDSLGSKKTLIYDGER